MPEYHFETHSPVNLVVEISKGNVDVQCAETTESTVIVEGKHADDVVVEQHGDSITVIEPGRGRILRQQHAQRRHRRPGGEQPGRPDRLGRRPGRGPRRPRPAATAARATSPLDTVEGHLLVETGSGEVRVAESARRPQGQERLRRRRGRRGRRGRGGVDRLAVTSASTRRAAPRSSRPARGPHRRGGVRRHVVQHRQRGRLDRPGASRPGHRQGRLRRRLDRRRCGHPGVDRRHDRVRHASAPACKVPASPRRARTTSRSGPRPSAATSTSPRSDPHTQDRNRSQADCRWSQQN